MLDFRQRYALSSLVYGGKMWVIGGYDSNGLFQNDVWSSSDGVTWTPVTSAASFSGRAAMGCVVFNNAMYVIGGYSPSFGGEQNDVWISTDGANWSPVTMTATFMPRSIFSCVVNNGKIWLITGLSTQGKTATVYDDVWSSTDGAHWTQAATTVAFSGRYAQTSVVYKGDLWVIGGNVGLAPFLNDVYSSSDGVNRKPGFPWRGFFRKVRPYQPGLQRENVGTRGTGFEFKPA